MDRPAVFIITGGQGDGKSIFALDMAGILKMRNCSVSGFIAEGRWEGAVRSGFDLVNIDTGSRIPLAKRSPSCRPQPGSLQEPGRQGAFIFSDEALRTGVEIIRQAVETNAEVIIMDEIGAFELRDEGWAASLGLLLNNYSGIIVLAVRHKWLDRVIEKWKIDPVEIFDISSISAAEAAETVLLFNQYDYRNELPL